jgi:hypothetical protein
MPKINLLVRQQLIAIGLIFSFKPRLRAVESTERIAAKVLAPSALSKHFSAFILN